MTTKNILITSIAILLLVTLSSCAPEGPTAQQYGFLFGIWHGICFPFALIGKVLSMDVGIYAENNTGLFYWVGYILGLSIIFGGGGASSRRRR
jgi:hypothetical protein